MWAITFLLLSLHLISNMAVTPRRTQNDLLDAFRKKHSIADEKSVKETSSTDEGESTVIKTILNRLFPSRVAVNDIARNT